MPPTPTLLVTRPRPGADRFASACRAVLGGKARIVIAPCLAIRPVAAAPDLHRYRALVLSSPHAVGIVAGLSPPPRMVAFCVGDHTAAAARAAGFCARSAAGGAEDLVALVQGAGIRGPLLHARGRYSRGAIAARLSAAGLKTHEAVVYDQQPVPLGAAAQKLLAGRGPVVLPLFSPRSAVLVGAAAQAAKAPLHLVAMSRAILKAWCGTKPASASLAGQRTMAAMATGTTDVFRALDA